MNHIPNLSEIEQSTAELMRFKYVQFAAICHPGFGHNDPCHI